MIDRQEQSPMEKTYRFWISHNGSPVRLSLKVGGYITITRGGLEDEGYYSAEDVYYLDRERGVLMAEHSWASRDGDGRMSGGCEYWAKLDELAVNHPCSDDRSRLARGEAEARPVHFVNFRELDASFWRRDHPAEAAGF